MKGPSRPLPVWLKACLGLIGLVLMAYAGWTLYIAAPALWRLAQSKEGIFQRSGQLLLEGGARCALALIVIYVGSRMLLRAFKKEVSPSQSASAGGGDVVIASPVPQARVSRKRWHMCNVLHVGPVSRHIWQFDARNGAFNLNRQQDSAPGDPLPANIVGKSWGSLLQPRLNVAWLPAEDVFVRVAHFPQSSPDETRAMVELQLEKLSPIPVTQAVWSMHVLPGSSATLQTVVVVIAARGSVEEFLGRLEGEGYLADRLELPVLDQLRATPITEDGAWIYPEALGNQNSALVAWWYSGVLQSVDLLTIPSTADRAASLKDQLMQMTWAGEMEGWVTSPPRWHVVADATRAAAWETPLREGLDQPVEVIPSLDDAAVAALTARRAAQSDAGSNLLPAEYAERYRSQFVDRLWMRGLGAVLGLYVAGLAVYFVAVGFLGYRARGVEQEVRAQGPTYTNWMQKTAQVRILRERNELKAAALECWEAVAETLPENITLDSLNFSEGKALRLTGSAPATEFANIIDFSGKLRKHQVKGRPFFDAIKGEALQTRPGQGGMIVWSFGLELKRGVEK